MPVNYWWQACEEKEEETRREREKLIRRSCFIAIIQILPCEFINFLDSLSRFLSSRSARESSQWLNCQPRVNFDTFIAAHKWKKNSFDARSQSSSAHVNLMHVTYHVYHKIYFIWVWSAHTDDEITIFLLFTRHSIKSEHCTQMCGWK